MAAIVHTRMVRLYAGPRTSTGSIGGGLLQTTVTASLSLDSCALPADSAGTVTSYAAAVTTMTVRVAGADTSGSWSFSRTNSAGVTSSLSSNTLTITGLTADAGYVDVTASRSGYDPVTKRFALSRVKTGAAGAPGSTGATGIRGTIATKISGAWSDATANAQIASVATASGGTPTTPISGDIVYYTGGAKQYNGSSWGAVSAFIDGSLVVSGTIAADNIAAGTMTGSTIRTTSGSTRVEMNASSNALKVYAAGTEVLSLGGLGSAALTTTTTTGVPGVIASSATTTTAIQVNSTGSGNGITISAYSGNALECSSSLGYGLRVTGGGAYITGNLNVAGTIAGTLSYSSIVSGLGFTPVSSSGSVSYATSAGSASSASSATSATYAQYLNYSGGAYMQTGSYKAVMQTDGNFVVYGVSTWGAGTNVSDRRQKRNIRPTKEAGLPMIDKLRVVDFEWKKKSRMWDGGRRHTGFIAQEVGVLIPDAMTETDGLCFLHKEEIVPYLVKAVQELAEEVRTLRAQLH